MKNFSKYLSYRIKASLPRVFIMSLMGTVPTVVYYIGESAAWRRFGSYSANLSFLTYLIYALAYIIPVLENAPPKSTRQLDMIFSLPVSRRAIGIAHYVSGALQLIISSVVMIVSTVIVHLIFFRGLNVIYLVLYYFFILMVALIIYSVISFLFVKGNSLTDGILTAIFFPCAVDSIFTVIANLINKSTVLRLAMLNTMPWFNPAAFADIGSVGIRIAPYCPNFFYSYDHSNALSQIFNPWNIATVVFCSVAAILAAIGFINHFKKYRAEQAGDISDSIFSYRFFIPVITVCHMFDGSSLFDGIFIGARITGDLFILLLMLIGYFTYRRSFRIKAEDIALVLISLGLVFIA